MLIYKQKNNETTDITYGIFKRQCLLVQANSKKLSVFLQECSINRMFSEVTAGPNLMALLTAEFCAYDHDSPLDIIPPKFCTSLVSVEYLVTWSMHAQVKIRP